jgi:hypothetical protein
VLNLFETHPIELYHLTIVTADGRRERLGTTGNHPFYEASERRFVPARELRPGCRVVTVTGAIAEVEAVEVHTAAAGESFTTYNIEVEEDHTYHVGELGTWVHNLTKEECLALVKRVADGDETAILPLRKGLAEKPELRELVPEEWLRRVDAPSSLWRSSNTWDTAKNSQLLRDNMADAIKAGEDAHHIVQSTHPRAEAARKLLDKYQIDINDAVNGVGLRPSGPKPAHHGHGLHSHDAIRRVTERLEDAVNGASDWASGRNAMLDELAKLKGEIAGGQFP